MKRSIFRSFLPVFGLMTLCAPIFAQRASKPIDLDRELRKEVTPDRAASYYHYSLAKLNEDRGNLPSALSEMETALDYSPDSSLLNMELAYLYEKSGRGRDAIYHAEEAIRLDPKSPDPHWFLAHLYYPQEGGAADDPGLAKAIQELEKIRDLSPKDERIYDALGEAYFKAKQPEKAIQSYEKYQSLAASSDKGYQEIAKYYANAGKEDKSVEYCLKALEANPNSAETLFLLAQIYAKQNKDKEAVPLYRKLLDVLGNNPQISPGVKQQLASSLIEANQSKEAVGLLNEVLKQNPDNNRAQMLLVRAYIESRQFSEALAILQPIIKSNPDAREGMEAQFYTATIYEKKREYAEAIKIFTALLENPLVKSEDAKDNRRMFQEHLIMNYEEMRDFKKVISIYQEMVKIYPNAVPGLINTYRIDRQFDKALALGKQSYEKSPDDIRVAIAYARSLADAGKGKEGAEILAKMLQSNPASIDIYVHLSAIYMQDKRFSEAEKLLRGGEDKKFEDNEDNARLKIQLATVYEKQKYYDRAETLIKEVLKSKPNNADALNYIGYMLADRGVRLNEAMGYVKEALAIDPQNGAFLDSLGWAYFKLNDLGNAEKYLLEADAIVKDDPTIVDHLGDLYYKTGNFQKAQECWTRSIQVGTQTGTEKEDIEKVRHKLDSLQDKLRKKK
jgi:tetratricopeptide (TPR) repeat protein